MLVHTVTFDIYHRVTSWVARRSLPKQGFLESRSVSALYWHNSNKVKFVVKMFCFVVFCFVLRGEQEEEQEENKRKKSGNRRSANSCSHRAKNCLETDKNYRCPFPKSRVDSLCSTLELFVVRVFLNLDLSKTASSTHEHHVSLGGQGVRSWPGVWCNE